MDKILSRRTFLALSGVAAATVRTDDTSATQERLPVTFRDWNQVRELFELSDDTVHMSAMLIASHPTPVREAIEEHRRGLDANPVEYLEENNNRLTENVVQAAGEYLEIEPSHIALTDSTTMGIGLVYNGLKLRPGDDILTTEEDYYVTHESLRVLSERSGANVRRIKLFEAAANVSEDEIVGRIGQAILPSTRLIALTWVHSSTGLKMPVAAIAAKIEAINNKRDEENQILLGVDGVHAFGVENFNFRKLGCDFLMAGCHKWLFGPRGTGIVAMSERGLTAVRPNIPSFTDAEVFTAWLEQREPSDVNNGSRMTPGGFKTFEHRWALTHAFELHRQIGKNSVTLRTHELAAALKEALAGINGIIIHTPRKPELSAGIVSFDVEGSRPENVVSLLRQRRIIASVAPYATPHVRLTPSIRNTKTEIDEVVEALREIG